MTDGEPTPDSEVDWLSAKELLGDTKFKYYDGRPECPNCGNVMTKKVVGALFDGDVDMLKWHCENCGCQEERE